VGRGLLRTQPDPKHGRRIVITLTPAAVPLAKELQGLAEEIKSGMVANLSLEEQGIMRRGLIAMIANLDDMLVGIPSSGPGDEAVAAS